MQLFARVVAIAAAVAPLFTSAAPVSARQSADEIVPGKYIIQLKPNVDIASVAAHHNVVREIHARNIAKRDIAASEVEAGVEREFGFGDFKGYSGAFDPATIEELKALPEVKFERYVALGDAYYSLGLDRRGRLHYDHQCARHPKQRSMGTR